MEVLLLIIVNVILPVFFLIAIGAVLHRKFEFHLNTLSKLNLYLLMPAVTFTNIYESKMGGELVVKILAFLMLQNVLLMLISSGMAKVSNFDKGLSSTFKNSVVLNNSGNFGLPVSQLVFQSNPLGMSIQIIVSIFQNMLTHTYGLLNSVSVHSKGPHFFLELLRLPTVYALGLGLTLNLLSIPIPSFLWNPIHNISNAFLAVALITLGAQSAYLKINELSFPLMLSLAGRLVVSPCLAFVVLFTMELEGTMAQALFIASSYPSSRNSAQFALEYNLHPQYAAQTVLVSTLLSSLTVSVVVYLSKILY